MIKLQTPKLHPETGKFLLTQEEEFIRKNGELTLNVKIIWYDNVNGEIGEPMLTKIANDDTLTKDQRRVLNTMFADIHFPYETQGKYKRLSTGEPVLTDPQTGLLPQVQDPDFPEDPTKTIDDPDVVKEADYFKVIPNAINGNTTVWQDFDTLIYAHMEKIQADF